MLRVVPFEMGNASMKQLLGGKGANLAEMTRVGLPVPPGFTITTDVCRAYYAAGGTMPEGLFPEVQEAMRRLEQAKGERFGDTERPLLVSVRSGSVTSMPGMMDTILNLGLNDETVEGLARSTGDARFAYDCYRRLIQMFGNVVFDLEGYHFEFLLQRMKQRLGVESDHQVTAEGWLSLIGEYQGIILKYAGRAFPQQVDEQLELAVEAVFRSWNNHRAQIYRNIHRIPDEQGTAVNIQSMVFGNMGADCGTGVVFTRNPSTGERTLYGEFLMNAQGEDVVAGVRTPKPIVKLQEEQPEVYGQLIAAAQKLEAHYRDMQDIEFTVERGKLYLLQTRSGKRTAQAAVRLAVAFVGEGVITREEAIQRIEPFHLDQLLHRAIDPSCRPDVLASGLPASPGAAAGQAVFDADTAEAWARAGKKVILVRSETTPEDIHGVLAAEGVLTSRGGMTSHAAVVARGMGKPCVCGCEAIRLGERAFEVAQADQVAATIAEGEWISIDGATGRVIRGVVQLREPELTAELEQLLSWADGIRRLAVYTNADTPEDAAKARGFGAEGIGLCRTEHMFMSPDRIPVVRGMILAERPEERAEALRELLPMQQSDFEGLFRAMDGLPVTIRLLDPPLHEFLPNLEELAVLRSQLTLRQDADEEELQRVERLLRKVRSLHEMNPMLGTRGCRLGLIHPEIYEMQAEAIFRAALHCSEQGIDVRPDIMIPLIGHASELKLMRELVDRAASEALGSRPCPFTYRVGTMIEVPRAAITAASIARHADFFSFGTNDLTQMTLGYSRDDAEGKFLSHYVEHKLLPANPFQVLDQEGVGMLIRWAAGQGRAVKPQLKMGVCGEHGGDKESIFFCHAEGLDYVSCSPYRVPLARIAAAQAALTMAYGEATDHEASAQQHSAYSA
ncbi:pyruvate, phosphate dikinase [Paenibacillus doosanensis]|uniref:pyruvate, phosphate dikinase n=1 Tax=Paenibacillus doosanensis TaxID=1229154 RepID=UPI00217F94AF|nr:pyruvate, phosphate dikinase [Paenibacillus doosanensis]MCS7458636.1 pyruvate, phosphate dikinase [Paenibacillus doosanensis]